MDLRSVLQKLEVPTDAPAWQADLLTQLATIKDGPVGSETGPTSLRRVRREGGPCSPAAVAKGQCLATSHVR
jgi:hypothetical protein